jgi:hypothetical protein
MLFSVLISVILWYVFWYYSFFCNIYPFLSVSILEGTNISIHSKIYIYKVQWQHLKTRNVRIKNRYRDQFTVRLFNIIMQYLSLFICIYFGGDKYLYTYKKTCYSFRVKMWSSEALLQGKISTQIIFSQNKNLRKICDYNVVDCQKYFYKQTNVKIIVA